MIVQHLMREVVPGEIRISAPVYEPADVPSYRASEPEADAALTELKIDRLERKYVTGRSIDVTIDRMVRREPLYVTGQGEYEEWHDGSAFDGLVYAFLFSVAIAAVGYGLWCWFNS